MRSRILSPLVLVLASMMIAGVAVAALPPGGTFDDDNGNIHESNIEAIAAAGITKGCNPPYNDRYCPNSNVTRGQMAAFLNRALGLDAASTDYFTDDDGIVFEADINAIAAAGITKGMQSPRQRSVLRRRPGDQGTDGGVPRPRLQLPGGRGGLLHGR